MSCAALSSRVRVGDSSSQPWVDKGIAQGSVLSPLLFNLLVESLAAAIRSAVPGVRLMVADPFHLVCQLYADDLVILADSPADLQAAPSAVLRLAHLLAVHFRYWPWSSGRLGVCLFRWCRSTGILASFSHHVSVGELTSPIFVPVATVCSISPAHGVTVKAYQSVSSALSLCSF